MVDLSSIEVAAVTAAVRAAFDKRKGLAWCAILKLDQLWASKGNLDLKRQIFTAVVQTVFVYGGQAWPNTAKWRQRVDSTYDRMLRYCVGSPYTGGKAYNTIELHEHGRIPMLSSVMTLRRINTIGHALRRDQALSLLLRHAPKKIGRKIGIERTIVNDLKPYFGNKKMSNDNSKDDMREEWRLEAKDREQWRDMARDAAARHEEEIYHQLEKRHQQRISKPARQEWEAIIGPLRRELIGLALTITASLDENTFETAYKFHQERATHEYIHAKTRINVFRLASRSGEMKSRADS